MTLPKPSLYAVFGVPVIGLLAASILLIIAPFAIIPLIILVAISLIASAAITTLFFLTNERKPHQEIFQPSNSVEAAPTAVPITVVPTKNELRIYQEKNSHYQNLLAILERLSNDNPNSESKYYLLPNGETYLAQDTEIKLDPNSQLESEFQIVLKSDGSIYSSDNIISDTVLFDLVYDYQITAGSETKPAVFFEKLKFTLSMHNLEISEDGDQEIFPILSHDGDSITTVSKDDWDNWTSDKQKNIGFKHIKLKSILDELINIKITPSDKKQAVDSNEMIAAPSASSQTCSRS